MLGKKQGTKREIYTPDYVVFDLETTGISPSYDAVIELSGLKIRRGKVAGEFTSLVNPQRSIPRGASQVNGITNDMVAGAPLFPEVLKNFLEFAGEDVLVGHNIHRFDMAFLWRDAREYFGGVPTNDYVDTLPLARRYLPQMAHHRLVDLADFYGISTRGAHRALNDCYMNWQIFERLAKEMASGPANRKLCPRCGQPMKLRKGRYGPFWGCGGYPACKYTENIRS